MATIQMDLRRKITLNNFYISKTIRKKFTAITKSPKEVKIGANQHTYTISCQSFIHKAFFYQKYNYFREHNRNFRMLICGNQVNITDLRFLFQHWLPELPMWHATGRHVCVDLRFYAGYKYVSSAFGYYK